MSECLPSINPRCRRWPVSVAASSRVLVALDAARICDGPLDKVWVGSLAAKSLDNVVEVYCCAISGSGATVFDGSSTSFSGTGSARLLEGKEPEMTGTGSLALDALRRLELPFPADRAASGLELLDGIAELRDAWAVFADTDAVGGPDVKIERGGGSKKVA